MNCWIKGDIQDLQSGIEEWEKAFDFSLSKEGIPVTVKREDTSSLHVSLKEGKGEIRYSQNIHFFRALGLFLEHAGRRSTFQIEEHPQFESNGIMLDCSRNAVMKPEQVRKLIRIMSMMGLNRLMLYMEDTYEVKERPYFGYMRGRYSHEELRQLDEYACRFGVEVVPAIQTLAHLTTFLRWDAAADLRDTPDILLAASGETYTFIEQMIESVSSAFRTSRIHLGMDEAHFLGRGEYYKKNGPRPSFQIMNDHLHEVLKITREKGLQPMIWSDMYFRMASVKGHYYDENASVPEDVIENMPKNVQFVYWDYYHEKEEVYRSFLQKHKAFGTMPLFAGGLWTWNGIAVNYKKAFRTTDAAMTACKKEGVPEVFATLWGDDGQETEPFTALLGIQLMAEHGYVRELDRKKVKDRFRFCTGADMEAFITLGELDQPPGTAEEIQLEPDNPSKFLLWQDPLMGLFDKEAEGMELPRFYQELEGDLENMKKKAGPWAFLFDVPSRICSVLSLKAELGVKVKYYYEKNEKNQLRKLEQDVLPDLKQRVERLRKRHYEQWMKIHKPFGWEVIDIRYGGLIARIDTTQRRLSEYLKGNQVLIEELEEYRLPYSSVNQSGYVRNNVYKQIVSPNVF
ncbi:beta-N-acetylhexosaminidase [Salibacterium aidingense]|uniref:beta-N-acetylhexosaminidase n=1 Tax=Salibacterium aidingense TaxID=384933 RepID=UPI00040362AE|nr:beta-N-acetylhexosaminidase [Salibacterium aidingense]